MGEKGLELFKYEGKNVRVVMKDGIPWWFGKDVCDILGYANSRDALEKHCKYKEKMTVVKRDGQKGGAQFWTIIPESDVYRLVIRSKLPAAEKFEKWVMEEVLPAIHKHGAYLTPKTAEEWIANPALMIKVLQSLQEEQEARKLAETQLVTAQVALEEKSTQLDESMEWFTVKRVAALNHMYWKDLKWQPLKETSYAMGYEIKKVFDANYGAVNAYHIDVWKYEYAHLWYGDE